MSPAPRELPTLAIPAIANGPKVLSKALEHWGALLSYPRRFVELHGSEMLPASQRRRIEPRRRTRLEAIYLVGSAFLRYADVVTLRVGTPLAGGLVDGLGHTRWSQITRLNERTLRRAIQDGISAGYWTATQRRLEYVHQSGEKKGQIGYCACFTVYRLTEKFFKRLGLSPRLQRERVKAAERARDRTRIYAGALLAARESLKRCRPGSKRQIAPPARQARADAADNEGRLIVELKLRLRARYPERPADWIEAEARRARQSLPDLS